MIGLLRRLRRPAPSVDETLWRAMRAGTPWVSARDDARGKGEAIIVPVCEVSTVADVEKVAASLIFLALTIPFTRMTTGPMDFTPGGFRNVMPEDFKADSTRPMVSAEERSLWAAGWTPPRRPSRAASR